MRSDPAEAPPYDPYDPAVMADPYPALARLRDSDPVHWCVPLKSWVVTRHDDVRALMTGDALSTARLASFYRTLPPREAELLRDIVRYLSLWLAFSDPPDHTRMRRIMRHAFAGPAMAAVEGGVVPVVDQLLDRLEGRGRIEAVRDYALQVPAFVIMDLLGVERTMLEPFKAWSDDLALFISGARRADDKYERAAEGCREMSAYFKALIAERRRRPRPGFLQDLIAARDEGEALSEDELIASCILVLFAGHETTTNLISMALRAFLLHPGERAKLLAEPRLIDPAIEEVMRWDGPTHTLCRIVAVDHELRGRRLRAGDRLFAAVAAANRDPAVFPEPDRFDIARGAPRHMSFGQGIHACIGARLAREEGRVAVLRFLQRFPTSEFHDGGRMEWIDAMVPRGLRRLELEGVA